MRRRRDASAAALHGLLDNALMRPIREAKRSVYSRARPYAHTSSTIDGGLLQFGALFGFGEFHPIQLVRLEYQIAQKLHAVTDHAYARAHDLVDLQLLWDVGPDLPDLHAFCVRTFNWRRQQAWPPLPLRSMNNWELAYIDARAETEVDGESPVIANLEAAREWLSSVIRRIAAVSDQDSRPEHRRTNFK